MVPEVPPVVIRPFRPDTTDDVGAKALEAKASQHQLNAIMKRLIKINRKHLTSFDAKARMYEDFIILLAVDPTTVGGDDGFICGCVTIGIKYAWLENESIRLGYLFDMRVHEDYQAQGLGSKLLEAVHSEALVRGVDVVYFTVNGDNSRARRFYTKHKYQDVSERKLLFTPLVFVWGAGNETDLLCKSERQLLHRCPGAAVACIRTLDVSEAVQLSDRNGGIQRDLCPVGGVATIVDACKDKFVMAWVAEVQGPTEGEISIASLILWDGDGTSSLEVERFLFTPAMWRHPVAQMAMAASSCFPLFIWARRLSSAEVNLWTGLSGLLLAMVGAGVGVFLSIVRFATTRKRERARLIAPTASGTYGLEALEELASIARSTAKKLGFSLTIANLDARDRMVGSLKRSKGTLAGSTFFMLRWLTAVNGDVKSAKPVDSNCFFDPRDLS